MTPYVMILTYDGDEGTWHLKIFQYQEPENILFIARYSEYEEAEANADALQLLTGTPWEKV